MKTKSLKTLVSVLLAVMLLLSIIPISAMAVTYKDNDNNTITSFGFTLNNFAYGKSVISAKAISEKIGPLSIASIEGTKLYESSKATPTSKDDLTETSDSYFQAGKQYFCAIEFTKHDDLSDETVFARDLTATLNCNGNTYNSILDLSENNRVFVYKLPVPEAVPYGIDVTTTVVQGGTVAPTNGAFELEVLNFEQNSNLPIDTFTIGNKNIATDGIGNFDTKLTIGNNDYEKLFSLSLEGIFVRQKNGNADGWTYDESVWFVKLHQDPVVNALTDDVATMPNISFDCLQGRLVDGEFIPDTEIPADKITFTNTYTENSDSVVTVKIPFVKKVTLGGNTEPLDETFEFEIFDIGNGDAQSYADVSYTAEVTVNGSGDFDGEIAITGPETQVEQYICEGFFVREVKGDAANWTYSDAVWNVVPEWNDQQQRVFVVYPTTKETSDNGDYYVVSEVPAENMIFENIYTENETVPTQEPDETPTQAPEETTYTEEPDGTTVAQESEETDTTAQEIAQSPKTGDNAAIGLWFTLLLIGGAGVLATTVYSRKRKSLK